jgi:ligand-binding sensor domain-containing protein
MMTVIVSVYNPRSRSVTKTRIIDQSVSPYLRSITKILPINQNEVLIGCFKQGLKKYNTKTGEIKTLPLHTDGNTDIYVRDITAAGDQKYWVATESGIYIYDLAKNTSLHLKNAAAILILSQIMPFIPYVKITRAACG